MGDAVKALRDRFDVVCERLSRAAEKSGREASDLRLMAVSKWHSVEDIAALASYWDKLAKKSDGKVPYGLGPLFGESYLQEAEEKKPRLDKILEKGLKPEWHYIGHIQSRKATDLSGNFDLVHSVGTMRVANRMASALADGQTQRILVQVNIGLEEQKSGVMPDDTEKLLAEILKIKELKLEGLMCLPPFGEDGEFSRLFFIKLRELRDKMEKNLGVKLPELSMGMSHDMEVAVEEGATMVRVGTDIFGPREG